jgi:lipid A 3-O-deacylase
MRLRLRLRLSLSVFLTTLFFVLNATAQHDSVTSRVSHNAFIKLNYENDYFIGTDDYYTQGIKLEIAFPWLRYSPVMFLLPKLSNATTQYEINFVQDCFTPTSITVPTIQYGDRPYAGYIYLGHEKTSAREDKQEKLTAELDAGEIGQCAECEEEQKAIHSAIHDRQPDGWKYQIGTSLMLNYKLLYEKGIIRDSAIGISGFGGLNAGTIYDNAIVGGKLRMGKMQSYFAGNRTRKLQLYTFFEGWVEGMAYNATLQGALFSDNSIYTLSPGAIDHVVFGYQFGICLSYKSIYLEYYATHISLEIANGDYHGWGHIGIAAYF